MTRVYIMTMLCLMGGSVLGQIQHPRASPSATISQVIGLSEVTITYGRPRAQGRRIMGDLVPYGRIWRVGANESTKITFRDSVLVNGHPLPPGQYALYAIPDVQAWIIIIHKNTTHWGDGRTQYNPEEDALRFSTYPESVTSYTEVLTIGVDPISHRDATLYIQWERTLIRFSLEVDTHRSMMREIDKQVRANPTANTYYESARYFQEESIYPERARQYLIKAQQLAGDQYYVHRVWALVEAQQGNYAEAITHAERSKDLAAKEGKDEFVRMNEKSIVEWGIKKLRKP